MSLKTALQMIADSLGRPRGAFVEQLQAGTLDPRILRLATDMVGLTSPEGSPAGPASHPPATPPSPKGPEPMNTGDDPPPLPDGVLPSDTEFDLDALMGGRVDAVASESMPAPVDGRDEPGEITDGPANGSVLSAMNTTDIRAKLEKAAAQREWLDRMLELGDPLGTITIELLRPQAEKYVRAGWVVPTAVLALMLERVTVEGAEGGEGTRSGEPRHAAEQAHQRRAQEQRDPAAGGTGAGIRPRSIRLPVEDPPQGRRRDVSR